MLIAARRLFLPLSLGACGLCAAEPPLLLPSAALSASAATTAERAPVNSKTAVIEDDKVRIEESRLRGQVQRITVQSKLPGAKPYEITVAPGGKDPSQDKGTVGKPAWSIFAF